MMESVQVIGQGSTLRVVVVVVGGVGVGFGGGSGSGGVGVGAVAGGGGVFVVLCRRPCNVVDHGIELPLVAEYVDTSM
jgi:hypothetical protein